MDSQESLYENHPANGKAIASLVLGIISCVGSLLYIVGWVIGLICGILAIIFGVKAKKQSKHRGIAIAGFVLGIIGTSLCGVTIFVAMSILVYMQ